MIVTSTFGGWIAPRPTATGGAASLTKMAGWVATVAMCAAVGTGGERSLDQLRRLTENNRLEISPGLERDHIRTPADNLARIRDVLSPAVSDLASALVVTRQSIYNWINGEPVSDDNAAKLRDLALAADVFAHEGIVVNAALLKRKFAAGKTLLQVTQTGGSARDAAVLLAHILQRETVQRDRMAALFSKRPASPATADFDLPPSSADTQG